MNFFLVSSTALTRVFKVIDVLLGSKIGSNSDRLVLSSSKCRLVARIVIQY